MLIKIMGASKKKTPKINRTIELCRKVSNVYVKLKLF